MKWSLIISVLIFAGLMTRSYLYCMGGDAWGIPFSFINPHPEGYWLTLSFRNQEFDAAAIVANYIVSLILAYGIYRLGKKLFEKVSLRNRVAA